MYSDDDLDSAVAAGAISADAVTRFRAYIAQSRETFLADEESFRLIASFNDIFVAIASLLLLTAVAWIAGMAATWTSGASVAAVSWGLAEFFTRRRRMALPSILLLLALVGGVFVAAVSVAMAVAGAVGRPGGTPVAIAAAIAAGFAWLHWQRFRVPITVAAGVAAVVVLVIASLMAAFPAIRDGLHVMLMIAGLLVFVVAMRWDMSDPARRTRRSDVAFWLHLLAAPLIVHPVFSLLGLLEGKASLMQAAAVILLYVGMGLAALVVDRRALLVSALFYVLYALNVVLKQFGAVGVDVAFAALIIGSALLLLSAFWHASRAFVLRYLPEPWSRHLPPLK